MLGNFQIDIGKKMNAKALLEFLRQHRLAVQASVSPVNAAQAAVVRFAITEQFEIVFDTLDSARKVENLRQNPRIALVIGGLVGGDERTVQYEGIADEPSGAELERLTSTYYSVYPGALFRRGWPGLVYVRIRPTWIRYSDYNIDPPQIMQFSARDLVV